MCHGPGFISPSRNLSCLATMCLLLPVIGRVELMWERTYEDPLGQRTVLPPIIKAKFPSAQNCVVPLCHLAGNVGIYVCWLHPSNNRHFCLLLTCRHCRPNTSATFCYISQFLGCRHRVGETCYRHTLLHIRRNQY
jgi:hypothetical protein